MLIEGKFLVNAPRQEVWDFLFDTERMAKCVPGVEEVKAELDRSYSAKVKAKIGFLSATFHLKITILEVKPPDRLLSLFEGKDNIIGSTLKQTNTVELLSISPSETEIRYKSDVTLLGKLGTLGRTVIRGKATQMMKEFSEAVRKEIEKVARGNTDTREG
jgi:carbon monoxide dehydrogenase subunit G